MTVKIKYLGDVNDNYSRFGKIISSDEKTIDIEKYFNCNKERADFISKKLKTDKMISIIDIVKTEQKETIKEPEKISIPDPEVNEETEQKEETAEPKKTGRGRPAKG